MRRYGVRLAVMTALASLACGGGTEPVPHAEVVTLNPVSLQTGADWAPQDGVFDEFSTSAHGGVVNNGFTSYRTAFEFSLPELPRGATIDSVRLRLALFNWEGTRSVQVHGYTGDGTVQLTDLVHNDLLTSLTIDSHLNLNLDVKDFVASRMANRAAFAGFSLREEPPNAPNYLIMYLRIDPGPPALTVGYTVLR